MWRNKTFCFFLSQKPVVVVSNLRKQYKGKREAFSLNKRRKVATKNISFCVRKGIDIYFFLDLLYCNNDVRESKQMLMKNDLLR